MALAETAQLVVNMNLKGDFRQGMDKASRSLGTFSQGAGKTESRLGRLRGTLRSPELKNGLLQGVGLSGGLIGFQLLGTGINKAVEYMGGAVEKASDLEEAASKVDEVFEDSAPSVRRWASELDDAFGVSERAALKSVGTFGNFLVALGQTEEEAAGLSTRLVELAGDVSSFNNQDIGEVLTAFQSGLAGETEPLRRLGIDISAARVEAELLERGIEKLDGEFTQQQKILGRTIAIFEDTSKAQGDAARTQDTLAGAQRRMNAAFDNLQTELGTVLLPVMTDLANVVVDDIVPALYDMGESLGPIIEGLGEMRGGLDDVINAIPPEARGIFDEVFGGAGPVLNSAAKGLEVVADNADHLEGIVGESTLIGGLWDGVAQGVENLTGASNDLVAAYDPLSSITVRVSARTESLAAAAEEATESTGGLTDAAGETATALDQQAKAAAAAAQRLRAFKDAASEIAETRSLGKINDELRKQRRNLQRAAEAGNVRKFAAATAAIEQLKQERKLRQQGRAALQEYLARTNKQKSAQQGVTQKVNQTTNAVQKLGRQKANPRITVNAASALNAISRVRAGINSVTGDYYVRINGSTYGAIGGRASGGPVEAGRAYVVGEHRPELFVPNTDGRIVPNVPTGGDRGVVVYVSPRFEVAAAQVEGSTAKVVRQQRFREKN